MLLPHDFQPLWSPPEHPRAHCWFIFHDRDILVLDGDLPSLPSERHPALAGGSARCIGMLDGVACWTLRAEAEAAPPGHHWAGLRSLFGVIEEGAVAVAGRALQVLEFDRTHRFCGVCGSRTETSDMGRARACTACGETVYPRIAPAMMVLVTRTGSRGPELLLARGPHFQAGMYSALAGFVEPGESLEDCVRRETREEVGVEVGPLRYYGSQSWPFPHSLMVAFTAEWAGGEIACQEDEIEDARWFALDALPVLPSPLSIARRLIDATLRELRQAKD